ncbi:MAG: hypothetical protein AAF602_23260, partial [Myxococcota bacterium]
GLEPEPVVGTLTLRFGEHPSFHGPSPSRAAPFGSTAFVVPPWTIESVLAETAAVRFGGLGSRDVVYALGTGVPVLAASRADDGWTTLGTFDDLGEPPPPAFLWDVVSEIGQVRLHDGGLAEGDALTSFTLSDVSLGIGDEALSALVRDTLGSDPGRLRSLAVAVTQNGVGAPDVFYRPIVDDGVEDWLWFVAPDDIPRPDGDPERPYAYGRVGFYADPGLTDKLSSTAAQLGDTLHEKIRVAPGDVVYAADDTGAIYGLRVLDKPSRSRVRLQVERIE